MESLFLHPLFKPNDFWNKYESINSTDTTISAKNKAEKCRYCKRQSPEVTFKQVTHLVPELLGENNIHTFDECDNCNNKIFSSLESHLAIFVRPYITILGIKTKNKVPIFQSRTIDRNETTRTILQHKGENNTQFQYGLEDDYQIDRESKTFDMVFRKPPFNPLSVYKGLVKIGLGLLPEKFDDKHRKTFEWLIGKRKMLDFIRVGFFTTLSRSYRREPYAELFQAKKTIVDNNELPEFILMLHYANQVVQIFLPFSDDFAKTHKNRRNLEFNICPAIEKSNEINSIEIKYYDLGLDEMITNDHRISFKYGDAIFHSEINQ